MFFKFTDVFFIDNLFNQKLYFILILVQKRIKKRNYYLAVKVFFKKKIPFIHFVILKI